MVGCVGTWAPGPAGLPGPNVDGNVDFLAYGLRKRAFSPIIAGWSEIPRGKFLRLAYLVRTYLPHDRGVRVLH